MNRETYTGLIIFILVSNLVYWSGGDIVEALGIATGATFGILAGWFGIGGTERERKITNKIAWICIGIVVASFAILILTILLVPPP